MPSSTTPTAGLLSLNGHQFNSEDICNELQIDTVSGKSSSFSQQCNHQTIQNFKALDHVKHISVQRDTDDILYTDV
jgi:hypothetical protein